MAQMNSFRRATGILLFTLLIPFSQKACAAVQQFGTFCQDDL